MEKYLTDKNRPRKLRRLLEDLAIAGLFLVLAYCVYLAVYGYQRSGFSVAHLIIAAVAVAVAFALNPLMEVKRSRLHANRIIRALTASPEGGIPVNEMESVCGVRIAATVTGRLLEKGYLREVTFRKGIIWLADCMPEEEPREEIKPIFQN